MAFAAVLLMLVVFATGKTNCLQMEPILRDDNTSTCVVVSPLTSSNFYVDFTLALSYINNSDNVRVDVIGENIGCSSEDDGKLFIFPISSWNDATGLFSAKKTCHLVGESTTSNTTQSNCSYICQYLVESVALRMIRMPYNKSQRSWNLCDVSNLFYENPVCRSEMKGDIGGNEITIRKCWIASGRVKISGFTFVMNEIVCGFYVHYADSLCYFGGSFAGDNGTTVILEPGEMITDVSAYFDFDNNFTTFKVMAGFAFNTTFGHSYGTFGVQTSYEMKFHGTDALYFYGMGGTLIDSIGVQYGEC